MILLICNWHPNVLVEVQQQVNWHGTFRLLFLPSNTSCLVFQVLCLIDCSFKHRTNPHRERFNCSKWRAPNSTNSVSRALKSQGPLKLQTSMFQHCFVVSLCFCPFC
ncbi:hypothetical protein Peur_045471 [Populus x canadensis]